MSAAGRLRVCIVGVSGKLGSYMVADCLARGYEVVGVCRAASVEKLGAAVRDHILVVAGPTNDREVIRDAVAGCDGVLTVLAPWGDRRAHYSSGTAQAVLDFAPPHARLVFSCGYHISRDGRDQYSLVRVARAPDANVVARRCWRARFARVG